MPLRTPTNTDELKSLILSVDYTVILDDKSLVLELGLNPRIPEEPGGEYQGFIDDMWVVIDFQYTNVIRIKHFYKNIEGRLLKHRDKDLPHCIYYHDDGDIQSMEWFYEGERNRHPTSKEYFYSAFFSMNWINKTCGIKDRNSLSLQSILFDKEDNILDVVYFYNDKPLELEKIIEFLPDTLDYNDISILYNLADYLEDGTLDLIDMVII